QLADAEAVMRDRLRKQHMRAGVTIIDPSTTFIDAGVFIGADTILCPSTHLRGDTSVGANCTIGPSTLIENSSIADRCSVRFSVVEGSTLEASVDVGPYSHIRPGAYIAERTHIGNFAEIKPRAHG